MTSWIAAMEMPSSEWVQVVLTGILVAVTSWYAYLTNKSVQSADRASEAAQASSAAAERASVAAERAATAAEVESRPYVILNVLPPQAIVDRHSHHERLRLRHPDIDRVIPTSPRNVGRSPAFNVVATVVNPDGWRMPAHVLPHLAPGVSERTDAGWKREWTFQKALEVVWEDAVGAKHRWYQENQRSTLSIWDDSLNGWRQLGPAKEVTAGDDLPAHDDGSEKMVLGGG